jgi:uncharacterized membrane protein required for colicin V production
MMDGTTTDDALDQDEPLGLPRGSVRSLLSLGVVVGAFAIAAYLLVEDTSSDLTKVVVGGWIAALGNVIGFYFGVRSVK